MAEYRKMNKEEEPVKLTRQLIAEFPERFWHLSAAKFCWLWVEPDMTVAGRAALGKSIKTSSKDKLLTDFDFQLIFSRKACETLNVRQWRALLLHELSHCGVACDKNGCPRTVDDSPVQRNDQGIFEAGKVPLVYALIPHDVMLFYSDIKDGGHLPGVEELVHLCKQLKFDFAADGAAEKGKSKK